MLLVSFFLAPPPTAISTLSLHDALPISHRRSAAARPPTAAPPAPAPAAAAAPASAAGPGRPGSPPAARDRKSTRLNSSHLGISYAVFCLKKKKKKQQKHKRSTDRTVKSN